MEVHNASRRTTALLCLGQRFFGAPPLILILPSFLPSKTTQTSKTSQDYFVESTRGFKHFVAKVAIKDNLLYACTAQAKEKDFPEVEAQLKRVVDSFRVPA